MTHPNREELAGLDRHLVEVGFPNGMRLTIVREDSYDAVTVWSEDGESIFTQAEVPHIGSLPPAPSATSTAEQARYVTPEEIRDNARFTSTNLPAPSPGEGEAPVAWAYEEQVVYQGDFAGEDGGWNRRVSFAKPDDSAPIRNLIALGHVTRPTPATPEGLREKVADLIKRMVSGPHFTDPKMYEAQEADRLACADAILAILAALQPQAQGGE